MRSFIALWKKEVSAYFLSPGVYVVPAIFTMVSGLIVWRLTDHSMGAAVSVSMFVFGPIFFWIMVLLLTTLITMRLFAEERRLGTIETLITVSVREGEVVLAKYAAALVFFASVCAPSAAFFMALRLLIPPGAGGIDWGPVAAGYLILLLVGAFCLSIGLLVSALSRSQVVAGIACFSALLVVFFCDYFDAFVGGSGGAGVLRYVSSAQHILDFSIGIVDTRSVVFYLSGTLFMLFAATLALQSERLR